MSHSLSTATLRDSFTTTTLRVLTSKSLTNKERSSEVSAEQAQAPVSFGWRETSWLVQTNLYTLSM